MTRFAAYTAGVLVGFVTAWASLLAVDALQDRIRPGGWS